MEKYLRYEGEFLSRKGAEWRVELWQDADAPYEVVGEMAFPADDPLEIEWKETDKLEPVQASCATLTVVSKVDRQYKGLYSVKAGSILLKVFRDGTLHWTGTMDTELYEEPFSYEKEYEVSMIFSDFALLERVKYTGSGYRTFASIVEECTRACLLDGLPLKKYISTEITEGEGGYLLEKLAVSSADFYDEDGEALSLRDALDGILRPLALRLVQRDGTLYLYDLHAAKTRLEASVVEWSDTDAVLGVDKVYNNVSVTFSPYLNGDLFSFPLSVDNLEENSDFLWKTHYGEGAADGFRFTFYSSEAAVPGISIHKNAKFFKIDSIFSGEDSTGVAWIVERLLANVKRGQATGAELQQIMPNDMRRTGETLMKFDRTIELGVAGTGSGAGAIQKNCLLVSMEILIDGRYNPYEQADENNGKKNQETLRDGGGVSFAIPFRLRLADGEGKVMKHYNNVVKKPDGKFYPAYQLWGEGDYNATDGDDCSFLFYYDRNGGCAGYPGGWSVNYQNLHDRAANEMFNRIPGGELISLPDGLSGRLSLEILTGWKLVRRETESPSGRPWGIELNMMEYNSFGNVWTLYKMPEVTLTDKYGKKVEGYDLRYESWLLKDAREELEINTIAGSGGGKLDRGNGLILDGGDLSPIGKLVRGGVTDYPEKLLLNTAYSNYGHRMNVLSGTVEMLSGFCRYTDHSEAGTYLPLSEVRHAISDESEVKLVEIEEDSYKGGES